MKRPSLYESLLRPVLFRLGSDAEQAHDRTLAGLGVMAKLWPVLALMRRHYAIDVPRTVFGVTFPNPVGLAPGLDKDGQVLRAWEAFGFGFVEVGTITRQAQEGNNGPRLFRLPRSEAVINRMGFKNQGAEAIARRLTSTGPLRVPLGISLGKSKATSIDNAVEDYLATFTMLSEFGSYFVVNVSSPNTTNLRQLQNGRYLGTILSALGRDKPILVKVAPDLSWRELEETVGVCMDRGAAGVIATNTTVGRGGIDGSERHFVNKEGGLSGRPLAARAREVVAFIRREAGNGFPIIGVGGLVDVDNATRMLDAGADLIQLCTGLIYRGPALVRAINRQLVTNSSTDHRAMSRTGRYG